MGLGLPSEPTSKGAVGQGCPLTGVQACVTWTDWMTGCFVLPCPALPCFPRQALAGASGQQPEARAQPAHHAQLLRVGPHLQPRAEGQGGGVQVGGGVLCGVRGCVVVAAELCSTRAAKEPGNNVLLVCRLCGVGRVAGNVPHILSVSAPSCMDAGCVSAYSLGQQQHITR